MTSLSIDERISEIEEEIRKTPYHKATEHHIGKLKARIAKLKEERIEKGFKAGGSGGGYAVKKTGDASVVLVGPPSVGKSTLLNKLTKADSKVASYDFTTIGVIPGMLDYKGAKIQIFDIPGIISGAALGKGRGKEVLSVARNSDLILIMVDVKTLNRIPTIFNELHEAGIRLNEEKPKVTIIKQLSGGIKVNSSANQQLSNETMKQLATEFRLPNVEVVIREDITLDRLIDAFMGNRAYLPYLVVINKIDLGVPKNIRAFLPLGAESVQISSQISENLDPLKEKIWRKLNLIRVYLKKDNVVDYESPMIVRSNENLSDILERLFISDKDRFNAAKIWGTGAKYPGQEVSLSFVPQDETVVQFV